LYSPDLGLRIKNCSTNPQSEIRRSAIHRVQAARGLRGGKGARHFRWARPARRLKFIGVLSRAA
jgi:hypothetical protein